MTFRMGISSCFSPKPIDSPVFLVSKPPGQTGSTMPGLVAAWNSTSSKDGDTGRGTGRQLWSEAGFAELGVIFEGF